MTDAEPHDLRVLVADERQKYLEAISEAVEDLGHEVVAHEVELAKVGRATVDTRPDIAIVALHEDTEHALELITEIIEEATCPVLVLADDASREFVAEAAQRGVFAYLDSTQETELQGGSTSRCSATSSTGSCWPPSTAAHGSSGRRGS
jgi:AmiR/NasT family two-component response regulator